MKKNISDLAIFGGEQEFSEKLHVGLPNVGNKERFLELAADIMNRRRFTNGGPYIREFENRIADFVGVKHCVAVCNGTVALEILARALDLKGEVILPSFTFVACAHALQWQEITPVFCDIDPNTHNLDPEQVEKMITPRTSGIMGVHLWGRPCAPLELTEIASRRNLKLLFDASHAFGCTFKGRKLGGFGLAEVFSFHATKFFSTFEGGAIVTNNDELAEKLRLMKNFGFKGYDNVIYIGMNGKMSEISAAFGLTNFAHIDDFVTRNKVAYRIYREELGGLPGISMVEFNEKEKNNYQYIVFEIDEKSAGIGRDDLVEILHSENVLARRYFYPGIHRMEPYKSYFPHAGLLLKQTEKVCDKVICLPSAVGLAPDDVARICGLFRFAVENGKAIKDKLNA